MTDATPVNVVWITCHDIGPDLGCYRGVAPGTEYARTPHLDRLAAEGVRFDHAFAAAPVCAPSRSAIITGTFPTAIGTMHMRSKAVPPPEIRCFPEYLRAAGYYCTNSFTDYQFHAPVTVWDDVRPTAHWRDRGDPARPFFCVFHSGLTHESQIYVDDAAFARNTACLTSEERHDPAQAPIPPYYPDSDVFRTAWARYSDNVTAMDHWAGDILRDLDADGLRESTLVIFWSDHGRGMPRAKRWPYDSGLRQPLLARWPGRIAPATIRTDMVYLMDLGPTVLTAAGLPIPGYMHGRPLFDATGTDPGERRVYAFGGRDRMDEAEDTMRTARDDRFRYIRNYHPDRPYFLHLDYAEPFSTWRELRRLRFEEANQLGSGEDPNLLTPVQRCFLATTRPAEELYDLSRDPHETENLADDPGHAAELARLRVALDEWQRTYGDLGLLPEANLVRQWRPDGRMQVTADPIIHRVGDRLTVTCATDGASIGWTLDPPRETESDRAPTFIVQRIGDPDTGNRYWNLYHEPFIAPPGAMIWFRAQRLGYRPSADVAVNV